MKTIQEVINELNLQNATNPVRVIYRTFGPDGEDLFAGACDYYREYNDLISLDGDEYSLWDQVEDYKYEPEAIEDGIAVLTVWYKSKWARG